MLVQHFLEKSARRLSDKVAVICGGQRFTYRQIDHYSNQLAASLIEMGIHHQDRVVILLDNSVEAVISLFGIMKAGGIFIMLNPSMKARKLNYILKDSGAIAMITKREKLNIVKDATVGAHDLKNIIWVNRLIGQSKEKLDIKNYYLDDIISMTPFSDFIPNTLAPISNMDLAMIIYTSGSTGEPKSVMSAHYNVVAAARSITQYLENTEDEIILNTLPLSFGYGLYQVLMAFFLGGTIVVEPSFAFPYRILKLLVQEKVTAFPMVPTMVAILLQMKDLEKFDFPSLRYITNAAAALPVPHIRQLMKLFPKVRIYSMYGLTECSRVSYLPPEELARRPESVGIPIPNCKVYVVDSQGNKLGPNQVGELVVSGPNVMQGYWNSPAETAKRFRFCEDPRNAVLYTGDLFRQDEKGFLYFVARKDELIKTKGELVSPKEIENIICEIKGVVEAAVIGVPDDILGTSVKAFIVTNGSGNASKNRILSYCKKNLEPYMVPKYIEYKERLPKNSAGKIDKRLLSSNLSS